MRHSHSGDRVQEAVKGSRDVFSVGQVSSGVARLGHTGAHWGTCPSN